jgi:hypothetical protein
MENKCKNHPKYTARRRPRSGCEICQQIFEAAKNDPERDKIKEEESRTKKAMRLFGRNSGKRLFLSSNDLAPVLKQSKDGTLSTVGKLIADNKLTVLRNRAGEQIYACRAPEIFEYTSWELIEHLQDSYFNLIGKWLEESLSAKKEISFTLEKLEEFVQEIDLPAQFIYYFTRCFVEYGLVKVDEYDELCLVSKQADLSAAHLRKIAMTNKLAILAGEEEPLDVVNDPFRILEKFHALHDKETKITSIPIAVDNALKILHICEVRIGHQDTDIKQLEATIASLESMLPLDRPDIIIVSGLIQGSFQHVQKSRRNTLVSGLKSLNQQLAIGKSIMERISNLGIKVILNKGDDDKVWAENAAVFMMNALNDGSKPTPDSKKKSVHWMKIDKLKGTQIWDSIYDFVWRVALEYQIRVGRRFHSADEVSELTGGNVRLEESLLLLSAYNRLVNGEAITEDHSILDIEKIPLPGKEFEDFTVVDDCQFEVVIKEKKSGFEKRLKIMEKHFFRLTASSMVNDPTNSIRAISAQLNSMGAEKPDVIFVEHEQQPFIFSTDHTLVASLPGMQGVNIVRRSQNSNVQLDPSHRVLTTRKEVIGAGTMPMAFYPDGSFEVSLNFPNYLEKMTISDQRIAIPFFLDWQTGSLTAASDLQAIFMDYCLHHILPNYPTWFFYGGDHIHGYNYHSFPVENQGVGLISADAQKQFLKQMVLSPLLAVPKKQLAENLKFVGIVPGNHEWNSGGTWPGVVHCETLCGAFEIAFSKAGVEIPVFSNGREPSRVQLVTSARDESGNAFKVFAMHKEIGGYGFRFQHLIVERGGRGSSGPPVYALKSQLIGNSPSMIGVDLLQTGHWHSPQLLKIGNITALVTGSLAGNCGYEYNKALHSTIGCCVTFVGGGLPPAIRFLNAESLIQYQPKGFYSKKNMALHGFRDDEGFDRHKHGFIPLLGQPQSAIQKFLWHLIDRIKEPSGSNILGK